MLGVVDQQCYVRLHGALDKRRSFGNGHLLGIFNRLIVKESGAKGVLGRGELTCLQLLRFSGKPVENSSCSSF